MGEPRIEVHRSHQVERLVDAMSESLRTPLGDPLAKEWVLVQGRGMALWLNHELSRRLGVWANVDYIYPRQLVQRAFESVLDRAEVERALARTQSEPLTWALLALLRADLSQPALAELARYVGSDPDGLRLFQLAERIASTFDEYLTYRPEWLLDWQSGAHASQLDLFSSNPKQVRHSPWQRELWRRLTTVLGADHVAALERSFHRALRHKRAPAGLPERLTVFALTNLPPLYVRVLSGLARHASVRLFVPSPTREFFEDTGRRRRTHETALAFKSSNAALSAAVEPNRLLESSGMLGAEFTRILNDESEKLGVQLDEHEHYDERTGSGAKPAAENRLTRLQHDILRHEHGPDRGRLPFDPDDRSITVHSCHGAIREVEVLHDQVLALLEEGYQPNDVLVMMPNVDDYAPLIEAVFDRAPDDPRRIPFRISDKRPQNDNPVLEAFLRVLHLVERRAAASEVLDLLALSPVHRRFEIDASELETLSGWVVEAGIRWGFDAEHKARAGVVAENKNSWRFGLSRLLLGYAMCSDEPVAGVLPYPEIEGSTGVLLGRLAHFVETLFEISRRLTVERTAEAWQRELTDVLSRTMAASPSEAWQLQQVLDALEGLVQASQLGGFTDLLSSRVVRHWLESHFESRREARGFLTGGVTFCALVPMRSIPFRVICLLGMNGTAFPRTTRRADFNLIDAGTSARRPGDPDRRADDRYLFLEALLSARERLVVSYIGQSIRDNAALEPSIVVSELLDVLDAQYEPSEGVRAASERFVIRHPLQPFSPRYFRNDDPRLFSYEEAYLSGAQQMQGQRVMVSPLLTGPLPAPEATAELPLSTLLDFFRSPSEYVLRRRLDLQTSDDHLEVLDREPFEVTPLQAYQLGAPALERRLRDVPPDEIHRQMEAGGWLPHGALGLLEFEQLMGSVEPIAEAIRTLQHTPKLPRLAFSLELAGRELIGELDAIHPEGRIVGQFTRTSARRVLVGWVTHLVLCCVAPDGVTPYTWLVERRPKGEGEHVTRFLPVRDAMSHLTQLVELFERGQTEPLRLFPEASRAFASMLGNAADPDAELRSKALAAANRAWAAEVSHSKGNALERLYPQAVRLDWQGPVGSAEVPPEFGFAELSRRVFGPLLEHVKS